MDSVVGLETFFSSLDLKCKTDAVVALVHWAMVLAGFQCVGIGDDANVTSHNIEPSELLPPGWNNDCDIYSLKYVHQKDKSKILLKIARADAVLLISGLHLANNKVVSTSVRINEQISDDYKNYKRAYKDKQGLYHQIKQDITSHLDSPKPTDANPTVSVEQRTNPQSTDVPVTRPRRTLDDDPLGEEMFYPPPLRHLVRDDDPLAIGRGDLDPTGRSQGGMLADPRRLPDLRVRPRDRDRGFPWGAVPPGARFDPYGPPIPGRDNRRYPPFGEPDPDHLPPPGYDDMFG